jgi:mono/diheme cytochrome c family protein
MLAPAIALALVAGLSPEGDAVRGKEALLKKAYVPPSMSRTAYREVWKQWGLEKKPPAGEYDRLFRERYGLHPAPYANGGYPMGLKEASVFGIGALKGLAVDCLVCHGGSIAGRSYVGLPNASLDYQALFEEMAAAEGKKVRPPFTFTNVRGTTEAGAMAVYLFGFRRPDLTVRTEWVNLGLHDDMCEDPPAWWLLKKKKTMYHTGSADTRSVRALMQFMLTPVNLPSTFEKSEGDFKDIRAYLRSLEPPKYPLPIDEKLAARGKEVFTRTCSRCHGTYGKEWTYPNRVVPLEEIGTDRKRYDGLTKEFGDFYDRTWFARPYKGIRTAGYQAPPLDGVWATAPYFHNGSVPTVYAVLNSKARPKVFTRSYKTDLSEYDAKKLGWKVKVLDRAPEPGGVSPLEYRKVYDTGKPGRGNGGHTFGDKLSEEQRKAVIEYLKTL